MEKRHIYISLAVVVGLFVVLASVGFFDEQRLTGFAVIGEYTTEADCVEAGYTWEELTEQNCTEIPDCVECVDGCLIEGEICEAGCGIEYTETLCETGCQPTCGENETECVVCEEGCVIEYTEVLCAEGCVLEEDLCEEGCEETCQTCNEIITGGQCVGDVCDANHLTLCLNETNCADAGGYWYGEVCNAEAACEDTCLILGYECETWDVCGISTDCGTCGIGYGCVAGVCEEYQTTDDTTTQEDTTQEDTIQEDETEEETVWEETLSQEERMKKALEEAEAAQQEAQGEGTAESETSTQLTGSAVEGVNFSLCEGCLLGGKCYDFNKSKKGSYCYPDGSWVIQLAVNETCIEDFECLSKSCDEGMCDDYNLLQKIIQWFKRLFSFDRSVNESNQTNYSLA